MKKIICLFILCFSLSSVFAEKLNVDFYGVYSASGDKSMIEMTRNLYFAQLKEMDNVSVTDKTAGAFFSKENGNLSIIPKEMNEEPSAISFFVEIETSGNGSWKSILHANSVNSENKTVLIKEYTSYYKILTEAKDAIIETISRYTAASVPLLTQEEPVDNKNTKPVRTTTESIAGTWQGEDFIDKIVILRGGRGFIIYKNGATMNINVAVTTDSNLEGSTITIVQSGKPNASFFPELSRKTALENAPTAAPLEWQLTLTDSNTLQGSKKTLIEDESAPNGAAPGIASVTWTRK